MGSEAIAREAEGRMDYWLRTHSATFEKMLRSATFEKLGEIMLVFSNYAKNYASTIYKSLVEGLSSGHPRVEE